MIWGMFMTVTMESAVFMGKNYLNNCQSIGKRRDLEETNRLVTESRPAGHFVVNTPTKLPSQSSSDPIPMVLGSPEARCPRSDVVSTVRPDATIVCTDDVHSSQGGKQVRTVRHPMHEILE